MLNKAGANLYGLQWWFRGFSGRSKQSGTQQIISSLNRHIHAVASSGKTDTFSMSTEALVRQGWVKDLFLKRGNDMQLLSNAQYVRWDGNTEYYLDHSPSGSYAPIGHHRYPFYVFISGEAMGLLRENRRAEIEEMIASGESIKSISYEEYSGYTGHLGREYYNYLCLDKQKKDSIRAEAIAMCEAWGDGGELDREEFRKLTMYDYKDYQHDGYAQKAYEAAEQKLFWQKHSDRLAAALEENGIALGKDEVLDIQLSVGHKFTVSGIEDAEKQRKIEDALEKIMGLGGMRNTDLPSFTSAIDFTPLYRTAVFVGWCENYLEDNTDGAMLADMRLGSDGKIYGGLPQETLDKLNDAVILTPTNAADYLAVFSKEEKEMCAAKENFTMALRAVKQYGYEKAPRLNCYLSFSNGHLEQVDKWTREYK